MLPDDRLAASTSIGSARRAIDQISLARSIAIDRQTASNVLGRLEKRGLIRKRDKDKRTKALFLTAAGEKIIRAMADRTERIDELILSPLSKRERAQFLDTLLRLVDTNNRLSRAPMVTREAEKRASV